MFSTWVESTKYGSFPIKVTSYGDFFLLFSVCCDQNSSGPMSVVCHLLCSSPTIILIPFLAFNLEVLLDF